MGREIHPDLIGQDMEQEQMEPDSDNRVQEDKEMQCDSNSQEKQNGEMQSDANVKDGASFQVEASPSLFVFESTTTDIVTNSVSVAEEVARALLGMNDGNDAATQEVEGRTSHVRYLELVHPLQPRY